jgi:hypothetical protein
MAYPFTLPQAAKITDALAPAADAAGRASLYITLKNCHKAYCVIHITQGNAATILLTINQATAIAGTGTKVLANAVPIWANLDTAAAEALVKATDAVNYTTDAGVKNKIVIFEIDPARLDVAGGFDCVNVSTGASNAANITQAMWYLVPARYNESTMLPARLD